MGGGGLKGGTGDTGSIKYKKDAWEESIYIICIIWNGRGSKEKKQTKIRGRLYYKPWRRDSND